MNIFDTTFENFSSEVIDASHEVPVLLDFWASWCGPCQMLMPIVTKLADEYQGKFRLAKVNIDEQQQLANQFSVRSVPTVKLIKNGTVVDEFLGVKQESEIRAIIDKHITHESDVLFANALTKYQSGDTQTVQELIDIANTDPSNSRIRLELVNVLLNEERYEEARQVIQALPADVRQQAEVAALLGRLDFVNIVSSAPDLQTLLQTIEKDPSNNEARYQLSAYYVMQSDFEAALEQLLQILQRDRSYNDDAARKGLLKIFDMLGGSGELVTRYRQKMSTALH